MTAEEVYRELERRIIVGHLKPRERLLEIELAKKLGIGRALLREVFRRLEGAGLVTLHPNRGVVVNDFSRQEIEDVYFVRLVLEKAAAPLIVQRLTPESLGAIQELNRSFEEACGRRDMEAMILINLAFHREISRVAANKFLGQMLEVSRLQTHQVRYQAWLNPERIALSIQEHREMLAALAERDQARYETAVQVHLQGGKGDYHQIFGSRPPEEERTAEPPPAPASLQPLGRPRLEGQGNST